jgi:Flp pilus assembly protein TadG
MFHTGTVGKKLRAFHRHLIEDSGQSQIEFAMCCTVLLPVLFGITVFGLAMNNYLQLTEATSTGARQLAVERGQGGDPCSITAGVVASAAPMLANTGVQATGLYYSMTINGNSYTNSCTGATLLQGAPAVLTVTYPCNLVVYGKNFAPGCLLKASTTEVFQ